MIFKTDRVSAIPPGTCLYTSIVFISCAQCVRMFKKTKNKLVAQLHYNVLSRNY